MPFPWKKVRSRRISQLVNDHLHISQKRRDGSLLVVETGFPTSLIDLFIKNREKLKKPSKKRRQSRPITSPDDVFDPVIEGSPISCPFPAPPPSLAGSPSPHRHSPAPPPAPICAANEICAAGSSGGGALDDGVELGGKRGGGDGNGVLVEVLKIFVVVVLALATKRLTVGITISAVLLLFLEYVGKHCGRLSKPFAAAKAAALPVFQICGRVLRYNKLEEKQKPVSLPLKNPATRSPIHEIQVLEPTAAAGAEEIQPASNMMDQLLSSSRERVGYQEIELVEMAMKREESMPDLADCKRKSRKAKIKSKMQKIVPKKFRGAKKEHDVPTPPFIKDEGEEQVDQFEEESENGSISSSVSDTGHNEDDKSGAICFDRRLSDVIEEGDANIEEKECKIEAAVARRYMVLCLIVLAGLIGGRLVALVLTLAWFLLLKLWQALPMIMPFNVKSG